MLRMKSVYHYRKERHFTQPPEATIWPLVADTARINEISGSPAYQVEERADAQGCIHRFASFGLGPIRLKWEEGFGEWQENRRLITGPQFHQRPNAPLPGRRTSARRSTASRLEHQCRGVR
jgi:hypothetical protein